MNSQKILFVDDEPQILEGIQDLLRRQRKEWDMTFVTSGEAALKALEQQPFDVIVSDMRMPGMDGAMLLEQVRERHPEVLRFVLSGHAEREAVTKALTSAQQFMSKPADPDALRITLTRALRLRDALADEGMRKAIGRMDRLPSAPKLYRELTLVMADPDRGIADVSAVVENDPAMSAKVLQLVNSAYFGLSQPVTSVERAVAFLGLELIRSLALTAHVFSTLENDAQCPVSLNELQHRSLLTARIARRIVSDPKFADDAFAAGLLHDLGIVVEAYGMKQKFAKVFESSRTSGRPLYLEEFDAFGMTHAEMGAYLLGSWGLPIPIVEAVAYHHEPARVPEGPRAVLAAVHIAAGLVDELRIASAGSSPQHPLDFAFIESMGLTSHIEEWRELARAEAAPEEPQSGSADREAA